MSEVVAIKKTQLEMMIEKQISRWYKLKDHPVQLAMIRAVSEGKRFIVVPAGRRSGKVSGLSVF